MPMANPPLTGKWEKHSISLQGWGGQKSKFLQSKHLQKGFWECKDKIWKFAHSFIELDCKWCHQCRSSERKISRALSDSALHSHPPPERINFLKLMFNNCSLPVCSWRSHCSGTSEYSTKGNSAFFILDKKPRKVRAGVIVQPRVPDNDTAAAWLCIVAVALRGGIEAGPLQVGEETELPFLLSERKHSREKWQEASRAFLIQSTGASE